MKNCNRVEPIECVLESLEHGEMLTKFVATDKGKHDGDFTVTIHGFVTESGECLVIHTQVIAPKNGGKDE